MTFNHCVGSYANTYNQGYWHFRRGTAIGQLSLHEGSLSVHQVRDVRNAVTPLSEGLNDDLSAYVNKFNNRSESTAEFSDAVDAHTGQLLKYEKIWERKTESVEELLSKPVVIRWEKDGQYQEIQVNPVHRATGLQVIYEDESDAYDPVPADIVGIVAEF